MNERLGKSEVKQCVVDRTGHCTHKRMAAVLAFKDLQKIKPVSGPSISHVTPPISEEQWTVDGCLGKESQFSSSVWLQVGQPHSSGHPQTYSSTHWLYWLLRENRMQSWGDEEVADGSERS